MSLLLNISEKILTIAIFISSINVVWAENPLNSQPSKPTLRDNAIELRNLVEWLSLTLYHTAIKSDYYRWLLTND